MPGMQSLMIPHCMNEEGNEFDTIAVSLIRDDCLKQNVVGHLSIHLSRTFYRFLKLPCCSISATVTSKRMKFGAGDGLEIPVECRFFENKKTVNWLKMQTGKIENNVNDKTNRCIK